MIRSAGETYLVVIFLVAILALTFIITPFFLIGVGVYAGVHLYRNSPARLERLARRETEVLYHHALAGHAQLSAQEIDRALSASWPADTPAQLKLQLLEIGKEIFATEGLTTEIPPVPALCNSVEGARYRDQLAKLGQARRDRVMVTSALEVISQSLSTIAQAVPPLQSDVVVEVTQFTQPLGRAVQNVIAPFFKENGYHHFKALRQRLEANFQKTHRTDPIFPADYKGDDVVETYLVGTPLKQLFALRTPFAIPEARRLEHTHIVAGSGHGKTQTLQYMISNDLHDVARLEKSVIVIDSQGDLIRTILAAKHLSPDQIVLIDPEDIDYPVALNLFSVGLDRLEGYDALERERLTNSIIELYDFVLADLLTSGMTAKQSVVFRYVTRLMLHIPGATIHTLRDLFEPGGKAKYAEHIDKLSGTPKRFFETEFDSREFNATKTQVLRRIYGVLENQTFERMFTHPVSKFDMFTEMNEGKLILVNTAKSLLKEEGTELFGRFIIALIAQAAQERAVLDENDRLPTMVYVDEASDYFDQNIGLILSQARKYKVGVTLVHQYLGQLKGGLAEGIEANTAIKIAGGVSARDAKALAGQMASSADLIKDQPKGSFATYIRGLTQQAVPMSFPFFVLERGPQTTKAERDAIRQQSRDRYAQPLQNTADHSAPDPEQGVRPVEKNDIDDPANPSPEL